MGRLLRFLMCMGFLPIALVLSTPGAAGAAVHSEVTGPVETEFEAIGPDHKLTCNSKAYWRVDGDEYEVRYSVSCGESGPLVSDAVLTQVAFSGAGCDGYAGFPGTQMDGGGSTGYQTAVSSTGGLFPDEDCVIDEVCLTVDFEYHTNAGEGSESRCSDFPLGPPPEGEELTGCEIAESVDPPTVGEAEQSNAWGAYFWQVPISAEVDTQYTTPQTTWVAYAVVGDNINHFSGQGSWDNAARLPPYVYITWQEVTPNSAPTSWTMQTTAHSAPGVSSQNVIGVGMIGVRSTTGTPFQMPQNATNTSSYPTGTSPITSQPWTQFNSEPQGLFGVHRPGACQFYWGEKIADIAGSTDDEPIPWNPEGPEPEPDPCDPESEGYDEEACDPGEPPAGSSCTFSFSDPSTWAGAGMCQIVKLIYSLIDAVKGIAGAILSGLEALFVPSAGFFEDALTDAGLDPEEGSFGEYGEMAEGLDGSTGSTMPEAPFTFSVEGVASLSGGSGGCEGPSITWHMWEGGTIEPLNACSGILAEIVPKARMFLMAIVVVAAGFRGFGFITAALGVQHKDPWQPISREAFYGRGES